MYLSINDFKDYAASIVSDSTRFEGKHFELAYSIIF